MNKKQKKQVENYVKKIKLDSKKVDGIKQVIDILSSDIDIDNKQLTLYKSIIGNVNFENINDAEDFYYMVIYPIDQFVEYLVGDKISKNEEVIFIYSNYKFLEHNICKLFEQYEGSAFCHDKTRTIFEGLIDFFINGKKIDFDYSGVSYRLPRKILKNHDEILEFYKGLVGLHYGNNTIYLQSIKKIMELSRV